MALEALSVFGLHSVSILDYTTKATLGIFKLPAEIVLPGKFDSAELVGGAQPYIVEAERTYAKADSSIKFHQVDDKLFSLLGNASISSTSAETAGSISTPVNRKGTSVYLPSAETGIKAIAVKSGSEKDLKAGLYTIVATDATHFNILAATDSDFDGSPLSGASKSVIDITGLINAAPIELTSSAVEVSGWGITIDGGSGPLALVAGDTCTFEINPIHVGMLEGTVGLNPPILQQYSAYVSTQKTESGKIFNFYIPKVRPFGFDLPLAEYKFGEPDVGLKVMYCVSEAMLYKWKCIKRMLG